MIDDLRDFLDSLAERGRLRVVNNAGWDLEIGTINDPEFAQAIFMAFKEIREEF